MEADERTSSTEPAGVEIDIFAHRGRRALSERKVLSTCREWVIT